MNKSGDIIKQLERLTNGRRVPVRGLGDAMAGVLHKLGIKPCESCLRRRDKLNKIFPFKKSLFK